MSDVEKDIKELTRKANIAIGALGTASIVGLIVCWNIAQYVKKQEATDNRSIVNERNIAVQRSSQIITDNRLSKLENVVFIK